MAPALQKTARLRAVLFCCWGVFGVVFGMLEIFFAKGLAKI
jgi:hypothetical protein